MYAANNMYKVLGNTDDIYYLKTQTNSSDCVQLAFYPWSDDIGLLGELSSKQFVIYFSVSGNFVSTRCNR